MRYTVLLCFALLTFLYASERSVSGQTTPAVNSLNIEDIVGLVKNGFSEELIITRIRRHGKAFDLSPDELVELRKLGVSDNIVRYLLDPALPYTPPVPAVAPAPAAAPVKPSAPAKTYPSDKFAERVPPELGIYYFSDGGPPVKLDTKLLLGYKQGAGLTKVLGKKPRKLAYLPGANAKVRIHTATPSFYVRLPDGKSIEELVLVTLERKSDRREIDLGPGEKQVLDVEAIRQCDHVEVGPALFRVIPTPLHDGEYLLFQIGSAEKDKGTEGKGADFAITSSASKE